MRIYPLLIAAALLIGCGGSTPTANTTPNLTGTWQVSLKSSVSPENNAIGTLTLTTTGGTGCFVGPCTDETEFPVSYSAAGGSITLSFQYGHTCIGDWQFAGTVSGSTMAGTYQEENCNADAGAWTASKE